MGTDGARPRRTRTAADGEQSAAAGCVVKSPLVERETWLVTGGRPEARPGAPLNVPPVLASNYELGGDRVYARDGGTPTWEALEELVGELEGGAAVAFASGMAAIAAVVDQVPTGGTIALPDSCYQGVAGLVAAGERQGRWEPVRLAAQDTAAWLQVAERADLIWLESPTNPLLVVADLPALCAARRRPGALLAVDSTFATPLIQRPLELGADVVVHSATKFLGGHSDLLLGVAITNRDDLADGLRERRALAGATPGALEAYLALRGMRTLSLRLERACASASRLAEHLDAHPEVEVVRYPGLAGDPWHEIAHTFMSRSGAIIAFDVRGGAPRADALCRTLKTIRHATSLGGVESTIERRGALAGQTHLPPGLLRLSVGCEHVEDLIADLDQALSATTGTEPSR